MTLADAWILIGLVSLLLVMLLALAATLWHLDSCPRVERRDRKRHEHALADVERRRLQRARTKAGAR